MNDSAGFNILANVAAAALISAGVLMAVYLLGLPIFDRIGLAWCLFWALVATGLGLWALITHAIWDKNS